MRCLVAYIPVFHRGYRKLIEKMRPNIVYVLSEEVLRSLTGFDYITRKDSLRAISTTEQVTMLKALYLADDVMEAGVEDLKRLDTEGPSIVMPDEDVSREIARVYLPGKQVEFHPIFLRWHRDNVQEQRAVEAVGRVTSDELQQILMKSALAEAAKSFDWWRQIGGVLVQSGKPILIAHNQHVPNEQQPYVEGDPRAIFSRGIHLELSTADHAEHVLIGEAARLGIATRGADLYVTDFPCPPCAKLIARSGIKRLFFAKGYAVLDGESILKRRGIEIIRVQLEDALVST